MYIVYVTLQCIAHVTTQHRPAQPLVQWWWWGRRCLLSVRSATFALSFHCSAPSGRRDLYTVHLEFWSDCLYLYISQYCLNTQCVVFWYFCHNVYNPIWFRLSQTFPHVPGELDHGDNCNNCIGGCELIAMVTMIPLHPQLRYIRFHGWEGGGQVWWPPRSSSSPHTPISPPPPCIPPLHFKWGPPTFSSGVTYKGGVSMTPLNQNNPSRWWLVLLKIHAFVSGVTLSNTRDTSKSHLAPCLSLINDFKSVIENW